MVLRQCPLILFLQLTLLNAGRKYLNVNSMAGKVFLTSGLGGMSGAQGKVNKIIQIQTLFFPDQKSQNNVYSTKQLYLEWKREKYLFLAILGAKGGP